MEEIAAPDDQTGSGQVRPHDELVSARTISLNMNITISEGVVINSRKAEGATMSNKLKSDVLIDGNRITPADLDNLNDIRKHLSEASNLYGFLSPGAQKVLYELHSENTWVGHIVRWGEQNTGEAIDKIMEYAKRV